MSRRGFTKTELLTVIAIVAILAAILFPVFARSREKARACSCLNNLFHIGLGLRGYALDHDGRCPPTEDDLGPLWPRYVGLGQSFTCPSDISGTPMGAPASDWYLGKQAGPPPVPQGAQPGFEAFDEPSSYGGYPPDTLMTSYYYRAGRQHNQGPRAPLCSDQAPLHNSRANVLFSDGGLRLVTSDEWRSLGFVTSQETAERHLKARGARPMSPAEAPR